MATNDLDRVAAACSPRKTLTAAARACLDAVVGAVVGSYLTPDDECARCGVVGPVDVACGGCQRPTTPRLRHRTITCDREGCSSRVEIMGRDGDPTDAQVNAALTVLGWSVTVHESGDVARDRHHCGRCKRCCG